MQLALNVFLEYIFPKASHWYAVWAEESKLRKLFGSGEVPKMTKYEEERKLGANPRVERTGLTFDFSRSNLPKCIEFHGTPGFLPETELLYEGKQFFVLHKLDYFVMRPIQVDSLTTPAEAEPEGRERASSSVSSAPAGGSARAEGGADADARRPVTQYSSVYCRSNAGPGDHRQYPPYSHV